MRWNILLATVASSWGFVSVIAAGLDLRAEVLVFWRCVLAAGSLTLILIALRRLSSLRLPQHRRIVLGLGVLLALHWFFFFAAVKRSSVAVAILAVYTAPIFVPTAAPRLLPERRSRVRLVALAVSAPGLVLIAFAGEGGAPPDFGGTALGLGAAVTYALLIIGVKTVATEISPFVLAFWQYVVVSAALAPFLAWGRVLPRADEWPYVLLLGFLLTGAMGALYVWNLRHVTAQAAGLLAYIEPVSASFLAWVILGQPLGWEIVAGGAAVLAGGALVVLREEPASRPVEAPAYEPAVSGLRRHAIE